MKHNIILAGLFASSISLPAYASHYAPAAGQFGSTAISKDDALITSWATGFENYNVGTNVDATWQTPLKALGEAQGTSFDIVSLGESGTITLTFDDAIVNGFGDDFAVFENSFDDTFLELAQVSVSSDGINFFAFSMFSETPSAVSAFGAVDATNIDGLAGKYRQGWGTGFDLDLLTGIAALDVSAVSYVRLLDIAGDGSVLDANGNPIYDPTLTVGSGGFDLDAIGVLNSASTVVPIPASIWLFGSGLLALISICRKKQA
ncbi:hypothetical protein MNBD_GAMMA06-959 [hydrothermal vent metagenome]|uniref:PEP-CTERM protein-sorting domain-containing protein n=1 Tax=hydrothermal vent metagenome TaxID=652676 RepID=A0A3B0X3X7_9ZZZZ